MENLVTDEIRYNLLIILEKDGNVEQLINFGYSYEQISSFINMEVLEGTVIFLDNKFQITEKGLELKTALFEKLEYSNIEYMITPQISDIIKTRSEIFFIPDSNELPD